MPHAASHSDAFVSAVFASADLVATVLAVAAADHAAAIFAAAAVISAAFFLPPISPEPDLSPSQLFPLPSPPFSPPLPPILPPFLPMPQVSRAAAVSAAAAADLDGYGAAGWREHPTPLTLSSKPQANSVTNISPGRLPPPLPIPTVSLRRGFVCRTYPSQSQTVGQPLRSTDFHRRGWPTVLDFVGQSNPR